MQRSASQRWLAALLLMSLQLLCSSGLHADAYIRSQQLHPDLLLRWSVIKEEIHICIEVSAAGWVGFGISEAGGMKGADIAYFEAETGQIVDAFSLEYAQPKADACQDWTLTSSSMEGGTMVVEAFRALDTGDLQDWALIDDSASSRGHAFIAAWGDSASITHHGPAKRAKGRIFLFGGAAADRPNELEKMVHVDILADNFVIPQTETFYKKTCVNLADVMGLSGDPDVPVHMTGYEGVIQPSSEQFVHHFLAMGFRNSACRRQHAEDGTVVMIWAPGIGSTLFPRDAGLRLLGDSFRSVQIHTHYNNPALAASVTDRSGLRVYYTTQLRPHDVGSMQIGDPLIQQIGKVLPPGWSRRSYRCEALTHAFEADAVTVFARYLHMHGHGERMQVRQLNSSGGLVRVDQADVFDFRMSGGHDPLSTGGGFRVHRGDEFEVSCAFLVPAGPTVKIGLSSHSEMCFDTLFYYPKQPLPSAGQCGIVGGGAPGRYVGDELLRNAWEAGRSFGMACDSAAAAKQATPEDQAGVTGVPQRSTRRWEEGGGRVACETLDRDGG